MQQHPWRRGRRGSGLHGNRRSSAAALVAALAFTLAATQLEAATDALVVLTIEGTSQCPSKSELSSQLKRIGTVVDEATKEAWTVSVESRDAEDDTRAAELVLRNPDGSIELDRTLKSEDCTTLAQALAIVVEARFIDLGLISPKPEPEPEPETPKAPEQGPPKELSPQKPKPNPVHDELRTPKTEAAPQRPLLLRLGLGLGPRYDQEAPVLGGELDISMAAEQTPWFTRATLGTDLASETRGQGDTRVQTRQHLAALSLGARSLGPWFGELELGGGVFVTRAEALMADGKAKTTVRPMTRFAAAGGAEFAYNWALRLRAAGDLALTRDRYLIDPAGVAAHSPRFRISSIISVESTIW